MTNPHNKFGTNAPHVACHTQRVAVGPGRRFWGLRNCLCLWYLHLPPDIARILDTATHCNGNRSMGKFELTAAVAQVAIMAPHTRSLDYA